MEIRSASWGDRDIRRDKVKLKKKKKKNKSSILIYSCLDLLLSCTVLGHMMLCY